VNHDVVDRADGVNRAGLDTLAPMPRPRAAPRLEPFQPNATRVDAGFFGWDMATGHIVCEPGTYRLHGLPADGSATMETFLSRIPAEDRGRITEALRQMMGACGTYQLEYRVTGHDGSLRWMEARGHVLPGPDGGAAQLVGFVTDTTAIRAARDAERRMYESEHVLARELQHGLLPRGPLVVPGMTVAARYEPATSGMEIGGDFYDAIELANGRVALVIGDVQGHNLMAASLMGQLRTVVDAYAREGHGPAGVMARANRWLAGLNTDLDTALFATCCFVVIDPARGQLSMCRAGHPAPALLVPGAAPQLLERGDGLPLGVDPTARYRAAEMTVPAGTTLVMATDGLLDVDGSDPDANVHRLLRVLGEGATDELEVLTDRLLAGPERLAHHGDDVTLLVARVNGAADRA
jgi:hypothetical protein